MKIVLTIFTFLLLAGSHPSPVCAQTSVADEFPQALLNNTGCQQVVAVALIPGNAFEVTVQLWEKTSDASPTWHLVLDSIPGVIGRNGMAQANEKREGDGKTPAGLFPLDYVFGYASQSSFDMPYRQAQEDDIWIDDSKAPDYNTWTKKNQTKASSFEEMRRKDHQYKWGMVVGYNTIERKPGAGSAIFIHIRHDPQKPTPTAGCLAFLEEDLIKILSCLHAKQHPHVLFRNR